MPVFHLITSEACKPVVYEFKIRETGNLICQGQPWPVDCPHSGRISLLTHVYRRGMDMWRHSVAHSVAAWLVF